MCTVKDAYLKEKLILVTDCAFAKRTLIRTWIEHRISFISRLQRNAALYALPKTGGKRKRGRPRKYGERLGPLSQLGKKSKQFNTYSLLLHGKQRSVRVKRINALWKPAGQLIQVLIVYYEKAEKPAYFFSTDLSLSVEDILTRVAGRWSLESLFSDAKEHLGFEDWQCRVDLAVIRSIPLTCVATSLLLLWSYEEANQDQLELWDPLPWYNQKSTPSIRDMLHQLRCHAITADFMAVLREGGKSTEKDAALTRILRLAA